MTVKMLLLKSGEEIVADTQEIVNENDKIVGYYLNKPCVVRLKDIEVQSEDGEDAENSAKFSVVIYPWIPLTTDKYITIPADWPVTIVEPIAKVKNMYKDQVMGIEENDQSIGTNQQSNTDIQD